MFKEYCEISFHCPSVRPHTLSSKQVNGCQNQRHKMALRNFWERHIVVSLKKYAYVLFDAEGRLMLELSFLNSLFDPSHTVQDDGQSL